jgi:hypothetical protein
MKIRLIAVGLTLLLHGIKAQTAVSTISQTIQQLLDSNPLVGHSLLVNQEEFVPGDTLLFAAHFTDQQGKVPEGKNLLQIQLQPFKNGRSIKELVALKDGLISGWLAIPDSLPVGFYNFEIAHVQDSKEIVLNSVILKVVRYEDIEMVDQISVHAEGGNLVESVRNNILINSSKRNSIIQLQDEDGNIVDKIQIDSRGIGLGVISPMPGKKYFAAGNEKKTRIPAAIRDGISINLVETTSDYSKFLLFSPKDSKYYGKSIYAIVITAGSIRFERELIVQDSIELSIPIKSHSSKPSQLLLLDDATSVLAVRTFHAKSEMKPRVEITFDSRSYSSRDSVKVKIKTLLEENLPIQSKFSVNVMSQISSCFNSAPAEDNNSLIAANDFVFPWIRLLSEKQGSKTFQRNPRIKLKGRAFLENTGQPVPNSTVLFFYLQKNFMGYEATVSKNGNFELIFLFDFFGTDRLFFQAEHEGRQLTNVKIDWEEDLNTMTQVEIPFKTLEVRNRYALFRDRSRVIERSYGFFEREDRREIDFEDSNQDFEDEFMGADLTVNVGDYLSFPSMRDLVQEVIPYLQCRTVKGESIVRVLLSDPLFKTSSDPLYIIDGHMTRNTKFFLSIKPIDVLTVKIEKDIHKLNSLGWLGKQGIVYVQTKEEKTFPLIFPEEDHIIKGMASPFRPLFEQIDWPMRRPHFKSSIYWNPSLKTDNKGESIFYFRLTDDLGKMRLRISGITEQGDPFFEEREFDVEFK